MSLILIFVRIILGFSATNLFIIWIALELNLLGFLSWIIRIKEDQSLIIKYFIIQRIGSIIFFLGIFFIGTFRFSSIFITIGIALKLGLAPLHTWFIQLVSKISYKRIIILFTIQKFLPFYVFFIVLKKIEFSWLFFIGILVGISGALYQRCWKKLLGYSSVFTGRWVILRINQITFGFLFFIVYALALIIILANSKRLKSNQAFSLAIKSSKTDIIVLFFGLLSLAGIPPMVGFFIKVILLLEAIKLVNSIFLISIIISSILITYIYVRLFYSSLTTQRSYILIQNPNKNYSKGIVFMFLGPLLMIILCVSVIILRFDLKENN